MVLYLVSFVISLFGVEVPFINEPSLFGIGFSVFVCGIAAMNLALDFDFIERGARPGLAKDYEWVRRRRPARHHRVAVPGDPAPAGQAALELMPAADRRSPKRSLEAVATAVVGVARRGVLVARRPGLAGGRRRRRQRRRSRRWRGIYDWRAGAALLAFVLDSHVGDAR